MSFKHYYYLLLLSLSNASYYTKKDILSILNDKRPSFTEMSKNEYVPITEISNTLWPTVQSSLDEKYEKTHRQQKHFFDQFLLPKNASDIELILPENDITLVKLFSNFTTLKSDYFNDIQVPLNFWSLLKQFSEKNLDENTNINARRLSLKKRKKKESKTYYYNFNGLTSDYDLMQYGTPSTGQFGEYWLETNNCAQHKSCNVYSGVRVLHKSQSNLNSHNSNGDLSFSCQDILTKLLPQIYDCVSQYGVKKCDKIIDHGYYRVVLRVQYKNVSLVLKMMKPHSLQNDKERDTLRNMRESILLNILQKEERQFINTNGYVFSDNYGDKRAFNYVKELGHCVYPVYISVSYFYDMTLSKFIDKGLHNGKSIKELTRMSLDIAKGVQNIHNVIGGPFTHTDIGPKQFMINKRGRVLLNDFNRGKFMMYFFGEDYLNDEYLRKLLTSEERYKEVFGGVKKCFYCPHKSRGNMRAPEEHGRKALDEKIDVFSAAMTIFALWSGVEPYEQLDNSDVIYLVHDTWRTPQLPVNMPFMMKNLIRDCLQYDAEMRPDADEFVSRLEDIYKNIRAYTRKKDNVKSKVAIDHFLFRDTNKPDLPKEFDSQK